jgi:hypothetical protein
MKRAVTVPPAARAAFEVALKGESPHAAALPDPLPMGRVLRILDKASESDQELKVLAGTGDQGWFLDYYRVDNDRDGQTFWHGRIHENGTIEDLENYEGQWGWPVFPDDPAKTEAEHQRILAHNTRVKEILIAKGFK